MIFVETEGSALEQVEREEEVPLSALGLLEPGAVDLRGKLLLLRNDCLGALTALEFPFSHHSSRAKRLSLHPSASPMAFTHCFYTPQGYS